MSFEIQPTGRQTMSQSEIDNFLKDARMAPTAKSPRVLGINQLAVMRAKSNGYPVDMYHPEMEMRQALKEEEEFALGQMGYQRQYIQKQYPKTLFRRNMEARFEPQFDIGTNIQLNPGFIEQKTARTAQDEAMLRKMKPKAGQSEWFDKLSDVPELDESDPGSDPGEDPKVTIARLQGKVQGLEADAAKSRRKKAVA